jgi:hypothetical protein
MEIDAKEIDSIKTVGSLNDQEVKLIRLKGGFHIAVGRQNKKDKNSRPISAGSHPGIVLHQIEKEFGKDFERSMAKSEIEDIGNITSLSFLVPKEYESKGYDLFSIQKNGMTEIVITKQNFDVANFSYYSNTEKLIKAECKDKDMANSFANWVAMAIKQHGKRD